MDADVEASSEIDEILQQIAELEKWREIFNSRGYARALSTFAAQRPSMFTERVFTLQVGITTELCK